MKKILTAMLSMIMVLGLFGCNQSPRPSERSEVDLGVNIEAVDVMPTGMTLRCTQSGGNAEGELMTGIDYRLEVKKNGEWKEVKPLIDEFAWTAEAWLIPMNDTVEWTVDWSWLYGELPADGKSYRIVKTIMDFRGTGDYSEYEYYAEFAVVD